MANEGFENLAKRIQNNMERSAVGGEYYGCIAIGIKGLLKEYECSEELKIIANELLDVIGFAYKK